MLRLLEAVRSAKQELSEREGTRLCVPAFQGTDLVMSVSRAEFEQATAPLMRRLWPPLRELGQQACVAWAARQASCMLIISSLARLPAATGACLRRACWLAGQSVRSGTASAPKLP